MLPANDFCSRSSCKELQSDYVIIVELELRNVHGFAFMVRRRSPVHGGLGRLVDIRRHFRSVVQRFVS